jgi:hypothetical protein
LDRKHEESIGDIQAAPTELFAHLNDHSRLSGHMSKSSWMMLGSSMSLTVDDGGGRKVGSIMRLQGKVLGLTLRVEEAITEIEPPKRKIWQTIGEPQLLVIGDYRMGFEIEPREGGSRLRAFIDYALPKQGVGKGLGFLAGASYARWCTRQMVEDAKSFFANKLHPSAIAL